LKSPQETILPPIMAPQNEDLQKPLNENPEEECLD